MKTFSAGPVLRHVPEFDGWRGMAILCLLIGHFLPVPGINLGTVGVNLFFVLSGLLMTRILFVERVPLATFYQRRIARIAPAAAVFITTITMAYAVAGWDIGGNELLAAATFTINYFPGAPGHAVMPFGHIWSLSVEEHSYIVLSVAALAAARGLVTGVRVLTLLTAVTAVCALLYTVTYHGTHLEFDRWIHTEVAAYGIFVSGLCLLASPRRISGWVVPACLLMGIGLHWWSVPALARTCAGVALFAMALNRIEAAPAVMRALLRARPLRQLGLWSYSIYLWQQPFYLYCGRQHLAPLLGLAAALGAGIVSFYLVEQPARRWLNARFGGAHPRGDRFATG